MRMLAAVTTCDVEAVPALQVAAEEISADELEEALREAEESLTASPSGIRPVNTSSVTC